MKKISGKKGLMRLSIYFSTVLNPSRFIKTLVPTAFIFVLTFAGPVGGSSLLTLTETIKMAQEHSFAVEASGYNVKAAEFNFNSMKAKRFPTVSLNASGFHINKLQKIEGLPVEMEIGSHENYQIDLRLSVPIYTGGKINKLISASKAISEAESFEHESQKMSVAFQSRQAWFNLSLRHRLVNSAKVSLTRIKIIRKNILNLYQNGLADSVDILETELAFENGREQLLQMENELQNASTALATLIGIYSNDILKLPLDIPKPDNSILSYQNLELESGSIIRPELKKLSSLIRSAQYQVTIKKAAYYPTLTGFGGYSSGKPNRDLFNSEWNDFISAGLNLNWSFNFGREAGSNIASAKQQLFSARSNYQAVAEKLKLEAELSLENILSAFKLYQLSQRKYDITGSKFRLAKEKQKAGQLTVNRLLEMESEYSAAEQIFFVSQLKYYINESYFLYAIGSDKIQEGF